MSERAVEFGTVPPDVTAESAIVWRWFKQGFERSGAADYIIDAGLQVGGPTERLSTGHVRTSWHHKELGTVCMLAGFETYNRYDLASRSMVADATPFYQMQLQYVTLQGVRAQALIEFNEQRAELKRSSEVVDSGRDPVVIWDEAMGAMDESIYRRAQQLGVHVLPALVERPAPGERLQCS